MWGDDVAPLLPPLGLVLDECERFGVFLGGGRLVDAAFPEVECCGDVWEDDAAVPPPPLWCGLDECKLLPTVAWGAWLVDAAFPEVGRFTGAAKMIATE